jgi:hypothetical protein
MVKCDVLFEVQPEFINNIQTSFGFKGVKQVGCLLVRAIAIAF